MKLLKIAGASLLGYLMIAQNAFAGIIDPCVNGGCDVNGIPEIDGSSAFLAIGLLVGLIALFREKFYKK